MDQAQTTTATDNEAYDIAAAAEFAQDGDEAVCSASALGPLLLAEFARAEQERQDTETRWLADLRQYRGHYDPDVLAQIGPSRSKVFVRKTRVKVKTIDSRVADLLFPVGSEKNWTIENTPVPSIGKDQEEEVKKKLTEANQGQEPSKEQLEKSILETAKKAAQGMSKVVEDQLVESRYKKVSVQAIHSAHLYGTGVIKGPLIERKVRTQFVLENGKWTPKSQTYITPFVDFVPLWRFYPDMAATCIEDCRYVFERHLMTRAALADLAERRSFASTKIKQYILSNPDGQSRPLNVDGEIKSIGERSAALDSQNGQYEVLERWGWLDGRALVDAGVELPEERAHESFFSNVWLLPNGDVIKAVLQPINGVTWPYHLYQFDKDETSIFGEGLASIMRDDQTMINASTRMTLDNAAITAGSMLEVNPALLSSMERLDEMHPWKIWMRNQTAPGQRAVTPVELQSHMAELLQLINLFEGNADEVTAIPRYMSGENATSGAAGTASGMSMLMGAANIVIKDLITSWDEGVTRPFLQSLYHWNMQFHHDNTIKGDFDVKARGTASLVAKEVRAQQLNNFTASVTNDQDAPYIKRAELLRQRAEANELSDVVKTEEEVKADMEGPEAKQAQEAQRALQVAQEALQKAQMDELQAKAKRLLADAERALASAEKIKAEAMSTRVGTVYAAMQAGGAATENPLVAPAGDEILRSAGWTDATPEQPLSAIPSDPSATPAGGTSHVPTPATPATPATPETGMVGVQQGIETVAIE